MPRMSQEWLNAYEAKQRGRHPQMLKKSNAVEQEYKLQDDIVAECKARGWISLRNPMNKRNERMVGEPDFLIVAHSGIKFWVECKSKTGKLEPEQNQFIAWAEKLGHKVHLAVNMEDFFGILRKEGAMK